MRKLILIVLGLFLFNCAWVNLAYAQDAYNVQATVYPENVSTGRKAVVVAVVEDEFQNPINDSFGGAVIYEYGTEKNYMKYINGSRGVWISEFTASVDTGNEITVKAEEPIVGEGSDTVQFGVKDTDELDVEILNNFSRFYMEGESFELRARVQQTEVVPTANVSYTLHYYSESQPEGGSVGAPMSFDPEDNEFKAVVSLPEIISTFYIEVVAQNSSLFGGTSEILKTQKALTGDVEIINEDNMCNEDVTECEVGATIIVKYTPTRGEPDFIYANITGESTSGETPVSSEFKMVNLTMREGDSYKGFFIIGGPDDIEPYSLEDYGDTLSIKVRAVQGEVDYEEVHPLTVSSFYINTLIKETYKQGELLEIRLEAYRPFSRDLLTKDDFEIIHAEIEDPGGTTIEMFDWGAFKQEGDEIVVDYTIGREEEASDLPYTLSVQLTDDLGFSASESSFFYVKEFTPPGGNLTIGPVGLNISKIDRNITSPGTYLDYILFNNTGVSKVGVVLWLEGSIKDVLTAGGLSEVGGEDTAVLTLNFSIPDSIFNEDFSGFIHIKVTIAGESEGEETVFAGELPVSLHVQTLPIIVDSLGINASSIHDTVDESGYYEHKIRLYNLDINNLSLDTSLTGNLSLIAEVSPDYVSLGELSNTTIVFNYSLSPDSTKNVYKGEIKIEGDVNTTIPVVINVTISFPIRNNCIGINTRGIEMDTIASEGNYTSKFTIINIGGFDLSVRATLNGNADWFGSVTRSVNVEKGKTAFMEFKVNAIKGSDGRYNGEIVLTSRSTCGGDLAIPVNYSINIEGNIDEGPNIGFTTTLEEDDLGTIVKNKNKPIEITLKNTGVIPLQGFKLGDLNYLSELDNLADIVLLPGTKTKVRISVMTSQVDTGTNTKKITICDLKFGKCSENEVSFEVVADITSTLDKKENQLNELKDRYENLTKRFKDRFFKENMSTVSENINDIEGYLEESRSKFGQGEYDDAIMLKDRALDLYKDTESLIFWLENQETPSGGFQLILIIIIIVGIVVGVVLYMSIVPGEEEDEFDEIPEEELPPI